MIRSRLLLACALVLTGVVCLAQRDLFLLGVGGGGAAATPALVEIVSGSNTLTNAFGTTVNGCPTDTYCYFLPEVTLAHQTIIGCASLSTSPAPTVTIADDGSNTYTIDDTATDSTNGQEVVMFHAADVAAGTRRIKVATAVASTQVGAVAAAFYNVALSSPLDAHGTGNSASGSSTMSAGSITPSITGDLLVQCGRRTQTKAVTSFTAGSQSNITWQLGTADNQDGLVFQYGVYSSTSAITPQLTMASNSGYATVGSAFKAQAGAGADFAVGMHIRSAQQFNFQAAQLSASPIVLQAPMPSPSNLAVITSVTGGISPCAINGGTDTAGNTYSNAATPVGDNSNGRSGIAYAQNAVAATTNLISVALSSPDAACDGTFLVYYVSGAATSAFVSANGSNADSSIGGPSTWTLWNNGVLTPGVSSGIVFWSLGNATDTTQSTSSPCTTVDQVYFGGENISGGGTGPPSEENGWGHCAFSSNTQQTWTTGYAGNVATGLSYMFATFAASGSALGTMALDNFDRTNQQLMTTNKSDQQIWKPENGKAGGDVVSNAWQPHAFNLDDGAVYVGRTFTNDQWAQCTIGTPTGSASFSGIGVALRGATGAHTVYRVMINAAVNSSCSGGASPSGTCNTYLDKFVTGTNTSLDSAGAATWANGDILYAQIVGTTITIKKGGAGGTTLITKVDSPGITTGSPGLTYSSTVTAGSCTDFSASNF